MVYYCDKQLYRILTTRLLPVLVYFVWMVPANVDGACFMVKTYWNTLLEFQVKYEISYNCTPKGTTNISIV